MTHFLGYGWVTSTRKPKPPKVAFTYLEGRLVPGRTQGSPEATIMFVAAEERLLDCDGIMMDLDSSRVGVVAMDGADADILAPLVDEAVRIATRLSALRFRYSNAKRTAQSHLRSAARLLHGILHPFAASLD
jgi:hypothetical protein